MCTCELLSERSFEQDYRNKTFYTYLATCIYINVLKIVTRSACCIIDGVGLARAIVSREIHYIISLGALTGIAIWTST